MALIFADSFDHYATADILAKWTSISNAPTISAPGRFGSSLTASGSQRYVQKTIPALGTYIFGFAFLFGAQPNSDMTFFATLEGATVHVDLRLTASSTVRITRNGTTLATGTTVLSAATFYYIEVKVIVSDTVGLAEVRINGVLDASYYGAGSAGAPTGDTRNGATGVIDGFRVGIVTGGVGEGTCRHDDLYVVDTTGSAPNNTYLGDVRVEALFPNGNGNSSQFVGSDADSTDNYLLVDETTQDGDTTYVESSTVGNKDTYTYTDLTPGTGTVFGVQSLLYARKTDAGTRTIKSVARTSATETDSADKTLSTTYLYYPDVRETKPGGGAWTVTDVNASEFGPKVSA